MSVLIPQWVQISNYKSIKDSGHIWLSKDLTVLAGKNESGKTAILEAIRDFSPLVDEINEEAVPLDNDDEMPTVAVNFTIPPVTLDEIHGKLAFQLPDKLLRSIETSGVTLHREFGEGFLIDEEVWDAIVESIDPRDHLDFEDLFDAMADTTLILGTHNDEQDQFWRDCDIDDLFEQAKFLHAELASYVTKITDQSRKSEATKTLNWLSKAYKLPDISDFPQTFVEELLARVPTIVFFSDFENLLPYEVVLSEAGQHQAVKDFATVAGLDLEQLIAMTSRQGLRNKLETHSAKISGKFADYYKQDSVELQAEPDGELLRIGVKREGDTYLYKAEQRSRGLQWFLSFFLRLNAAGSDQQVILIDEPGLYLHAKAQENILRLLEDLVKEQDPCRVLFSTHSPYLLDPARLDRVRLVNRSQDDGTSVENKIHRAAEQDTLAPVVTALGLDVARSASWVQEKSLVLEGISDYYYIQAFAKLLNIDLGAGVVPCVGASKTPQMASLLVGWGLSFVVLLDNDRAGDSACKDLLAIEVAGGQILRIGNKGDAIEDLFTVDDFVKQVVKDEGAVCEPTVTKTIKKNKYDKVLVSRLFLEGVSANPESVKLSKESFDAINNMMTDISAALAAV